MAMELLQQIRDAEARAEQTIAQTRRKAAEKIAQANKLIAEKLEQLRKGRSERITQAVDQAKGHCLRTPPDHTRRGELAQAKLLIAKLPPKGHSLQVKLMRPVAGTDLSAANVNQRDSYYGQQNYQKTDSSHPASSCRG